MGLVSELLEYSGFPAKVMCAQGSWRPVNCKIQVTKQRGHLILVDAWPHHFSQDRLPSFVLGPVLLLHSVLSYCMWFHQLACSENMLLGHWAGPSGLLEVALDPRLSTDTTPAWPNKWLDVNDLEGGVIREKTSTKSAQLWILMGIKNSSTTASSSSSSSESPWPDAPLVLPGRACCMPSTSHLGMHVQALLQTTLTLNTTELACAAGDAHMCSPFYHRGRLGCEPASCCANPQKPGSHLEIRSTL